MTNPSLILPQAPAYDEGFVYAAEVYDGPTPLYNVLPLDFTRSNDTATRVNSAGLIEKVRTNLLLQSEAFSTSPWGTQIIGTGVTPVITQNNATAPDGTQTADTIFFDAGVGTSGDRSLITQTISATAATYTGSFYARVSSGTGQLVFRHAGAALYTTANLTTTWQRFFSVETSFGASVPVEIGIRRGLPNEPINASVTVEMWGAQIEVSDFGATDYIPTTTTAVSVGMTANVPRLDYSGGGCPKLLLESQRTNLALYSEQFDNAGWTKLASTITANVAVSPDGYQNADNWVGTSANLFRGGTTGVEHTISVYAKSNGQNKDKFKLRLGNDVSAEFTATSEWKRFSFTGTPTTSVFGLTTSDSPNNEVDILVWGAQIEAASYATSYIPTLGAAVTRGADAFLRNNIYTNNLITASGGTWFVELDNNIAYTRDKFGALWVGDNSSSGITGNSLSIRQQGGTNRLSVVKTISTTPISIFSTTTLKLKIAIKWNGTSADVFVNGVKEVSATAFTTTNMEFLAQTEIVPMFIEQMLLFPTPLTDTQAIELTTL
jgi:hypothetical protein